jgi:cytochrome c oxidase cbb3-type subunit 3
MCAKQIKKIDSVETTGHSWDGIEELNNPLPKWWVYTLYLCIIWALGYTVVYPAWPMLHGATRGILGSTERAAVDVEIARFDAANAEIKSALVAADLNSIPQDEALKTYAISAGASVFKTNCAACHGAGAAGAKGYPNCLDDDWLWGGDLMSIHATLLHGIRNTTDPDARLSQMPSFGTDEILEPDQIAQVIEHVLKISGQEFDPTLSAQGATVFSENCAACHMQDGIGNHDLGSPNLTDAIWLYGGDRATLMETITKARYGVMPAWGGKLSEDEIRAVAIYVHSLGGGKAPIATP